MPTATPTAMKKEHGVELAKIQESLEQCTVTTDQLLGQLEERLSIVLHVPNPPAENTVEAEPLSVPLLRELDNHQGTLCSLNRRLQEILERLAL